MQRDLDEARQKQLEKERKASLGTGGPQKDPDDDKNKNKNGDNKKKEEKKERVVNTMTVSEAKKTKIFKKYFRYWQNGYYQSSKNIKEVEHLRDVKYLKWDHLHNEWEAFCKDEFHLGAYDPKLQVKYKGPVTGRKLR